MCQGGKNCPIRIMFTLTDFACFLFSVFFVKISINTFEIFVYIGQAIDQ